MAVTELPGAAIDNQAKYDVGGVLLERPFKIGRLGHSGFNFTCLDEALHVYTDLLARPFKIVRIGQVRLRGELGLSPHTTSLSFGMQLAVS